MAQLKDSKLCSSRPKGKPVQPISFGVSFPNRHGRPATAVERAARHCQDCKNRVPFRDSTYDVPCDALFSNPYEMVEAARNGC